MQVQGNTSHIYALGGSFINFNFITHNMPLINKISFFSNTPGHQDQTMHLYIQSLIGFAKIDFS
jgi:hypothetical protein